MAYQGNRIKIPLGQYGLFTDISPDQSPPGALIQAQNVCFYNGYAEKAPGALRWNATATQAGIIAAHYWVPNILAAQDVRYVVADSAGNLYAGQNRVFGNPINTSIYSTLTPNCVFTEGGAEEAGRSKKLFFFTGGATLPYVLSAHGTAFTTIALPNSDWTSANVFPKFGVVHRGSLWAFAGQNSYTSDPTDHEDFANLTTTAVQAVYPGEGGEIRGAFVYKGRMFAFKDGGYVYSLNDLDSDAGNWYWQKIASNFGLAAPNAIAEVVDDLMVGNTYGTITSYAATQNLGSVEAADVIQNMRFESYLRNFTSKAGVPFEHMKYYAEKKMLFMTMRSTYGTTNDAMLMIDLGNQNWLQSSGQAYGSSAGLRASIWVKGSPQCLAHYKDPFQLDRLMYGDANGFLNLMDYADRLEGTASYTGVFQIPHTDFGFADPSLSAIQKHFDFIAVHYIPTVNATLSCDYFIDGAYIDTIRFSLSQYKRPQLDTIQTDIDRGGQPTTEVVRHKICGSGRTLSVKFYQAGSNQSFKVPAITVYFRGGGDKVQQRT